MIAGASGLVGSACLTELLARPDYERVIALGRRRPPAAHPKLEPLLVELEALGPLPPCEDVFCCLGTTITKAGGPEAFLRVDVAAVVRLAGLAKKAGAARFALVSSMGADPGSRLLYSRAKGAAERGVRSLGLRSVGLFRPSLLLGARAESRPAESIARSVLPLLSPLMLGPLRPYRPIRAETVGRAMVLWALGARPGVEVFPSDRIESLGAAPRGEAQPRHIL